MSSGLRVWLVSKDEAAQGDLGWLSQVRQKRARVQ